jgi:hypothetical protein
MIRICLCVGLTLLTISLLTAKQVWPLTVSDSAFIILVIMLMFSWMLLIATSRTPKFVRDVEVDPLQRVKPLKPLERSNPYYDPGLKRVGRAYAPRPAQQPVQNDTLLTAALLSSSDYERSGRASSSDYEPSGYSSSSSSSGGCDS